MSIRKISLVFCILLCASIASAQRYSSYELSTLLFVARGESPTATLEDVANAQYEAGSRFFFGNGGAQKDYGKAHYWYLKSANNGQRYAQYAAGLLYYDGIGVDKNKREALSWFEKAGLNHYHPASLRAGKMFLNGEGTMRDYNRAARMFKDAAFGDIPEGMYYYALCFAYGYGVQADSAKALLWADRAIERGFNETYWLLGNMYREGKAVHKNDNAALYYLEAGDELNVSECQNDLGVGYSRGSFVKKDRDKAMAYFLKAANNGNLTAMSNLAGNYYLKDSEYYDPSQAIYWYRKLVDSGDEEYTDYLLSLYMETGDYMSAIRIYEKQAAKGNTSALNSLAYIYAKGNGVKVNYDLALSLIEQAISLEPDNMDFQDSKGEILVMKGDIKKAKKVWKLINSKQPFYYQNWIKEKGQEPPFYTYMKENGK